MQIFIFCTPGTNGLCNFFIWMNHHYTTGRKWSSKRKFWNLLFWYILIYIKTLFKTFSNGFLLFFTFLLLLLLLFRWAVCLEAVPRSPMSLSHQQRFGLSFSLSLSPFPPSLYLSLAHFQLLFLFIYVNNLLLISKMFMQVYFVTNNKQLNFAPI